MKYFFKLFLFNFFCFIFFYSFSSGQIIREIKISGNERISDETVVMFSGIEIGENLKDTDLNNVLKNLYDTNFFDNIIDNFFALCKNNNKDKSEMY